MANKTFNEFLCEVSLLAGEILDSELIARSIALARGPLINRRRQLANALHKESTGLIFVPYFEHEPIVDLRKCAAIFTALNVEFENPNTTYDRKQAIIMNLKFLDARISRILCTTNEEKSIANELLRSVKKITLSDVNNANQSQHESSHASDVNNSNYVHDSPNGKMGGASAIPTRTVPTANTKTVLNANHFQVEEAMANLQIHSTPSHPRPNEFNFNTTQNSNDSHAKNFSFKLPVYKWKINFSGKNDKSDAFEFLRIVKSKSRSYCISDDELFASASDLFTGEASKWYFSQQFLDWNDLETKLISDFMQVNYFEDLIDTIRQRKQTPSESIVQFVTIFEDNCSRLLFPIAAQEKISILKRNVLYKYQPYVALAQFNSVNELKHALKILEATMSYNNSNTDRMVRFNSRDRQPNNSSNSDSNQRHVSRFDKNNSNNNSGTDRGRSLSNSNSNFRNHSPYPNNAKSRPNDSYKSPNGQRDRERNNSNGRYSRDNSKDSSFRQRSRENSLNRNKSDLN